MELRRYQALVDGEWIAGSRAFEATSPSTGEVFATVTDGDASLADAAVKAAAEKAPSWASLAPVERASCLAEVAAAIRAGRDDLARVLTTDQGKPLVAEAYGEVDEAAEYFTMAAEDAKTIAGSVPPSVSAERRVLVQRSARRDRRRDTLELALHDGSRARRAGDGGREHCRLGAGADDRRLLGGLRRGHRGNKLARRSLQLRARPGTCRR